MEASSATLPADLVREVLRRCDHGTVIRCAASSRFLRSCMDDPAFLRRWAAAPSLLLGFFTGMPTRFVESPTVGPAAILGPDQPEACCGGLPGWKPAACHGGLVVLKRGRSGSRRAAEVIIELCVCEPMTGRRSFLPPQGIDDVHSVALLDATPTATAPFQLLAVDLSIHTGVTRSQLFESSSFPSGPDKSSSTVMAAGAWGPVATAAVPEDQEIRYVRTDTAPVVVGRMLHWLCGSDTCYSVLALHADEGSVRVLDGPWKYKFSKRVDGDVMLASTGTGTGTAAAGGDEEQLLSLVVLEERVISVSVLPAIPATRRFHGPNGWTRRAVIPRDGLPSQLRLDWFGERSGTVVVGVAGGARLVISLEDGSARRVQGALEWPCCLYEMDLASLVLAKKSSLLPSSPATSY